MSEPRELPDPEEVSVDYLIEPRPPSHEFHFGLKSMLGALAVVALLAGLLSMLFG